ncbi:MAG: amidohydrolase family protein [Azospirillaceae bacterium]
MTRNAYLLGFPVVDAHFHLWRRGENPYPWLADDSPAPALGDHRPLMRDFTLANHRSEIGRLVDLAGGVHVEAGCADPAAETAWIERVAAAAGFPLVHVARVDMTADDAGPSIRDLAQHDVVRGFRMRLNADPKIAGRGGIADEPDFRRAFAVLAETGRLFELSLYPPQAGEGERLARDFPDTALVLNHLGWPRIAAGHDSFAEWRDYMRRLAACPNVTVKLSMLFPIDRDWRTDAIRPFVEETLALFGAGRVMWGSNYPVETVMGAAEAQLTALLDCLDVLSDGELQAVFRTTAARVFALPID